MIGVTSTTTLRLHVGTREHEEPMDDAKWIDRFSSVVRCHDYDTAAAREFALIAKAIGVNRKSFDRLIAAHALALGLVLVTSNVKHFAHVPGLKVENWTE